MAWKVIDTSGNSKGVGPRSGWSVIDTNGYVQTDVLESAVDHGGLGGLADDDHTQYVLRSILTTNGDLFTRTAGAVARLGIGTDGQVLSVVSGAPAWADAAAGGGMTKDVTQASHGFSVGDVVYYTGSVYALADASTEATAEVVGIVSAVDGTDDFTITMGGHVTGLSGLTAGSVYFLSETAGDLTATEPTTTGVISKPLLIADSTTSGYFFNMRGQEVGTAGSTLAVQRFSGDGSDTTFTLSSSPNEENTFVFVSGVYQQKDTYSLSGTTLTFSAAPPSGTDNIEVVTVGALAIGTASDLDGTAVQHIIPGGRLTLTTATPVMTAEAAAQTTIYYTPYVHDQVPLYDGAKWTRKTFTELSIAMAGSANWASGSVYDLYVYNDGGTLRLVTGAAWTNDTTRSESLTRLNGRYVNAASMTGRYAASSTVTVPQYQGLYVGTFRASANGTTTWELGGSAAGGDPGFLYVWNCYNRVPVAVVCRDSTDSWTYGTASWASLNASTSNRVSFVRGLNEDPVWGDLSMCVAPPSASNAAIGFGLDSTSALWANSSCNVANATGALNAAADSCAYSGAPGLGYHYVQALQYAAAASGTYYGDAGTAYFQEALTFNGMF